MAFLAKIGPGLLFAAAAIGVSHLVYATQAGALAGWGLIWPILLVHFFKYPFFEFGTRYAAATGQDLLRAYAGMNRNLLLVFIALSVLTLFTVQAAVSLLTAGLMQFIFGGDLYVHIVILLLICLILIRKGSYPQLDLMMKLLIFSLSILSIWALIQAFRFSENRLEWYFFWPQNLKAWHFLIALMGWMPAPLDLSVWQSFWTLDKKKQISFNLSNALLDFRLGYAVTLVLALVFLALGALQLQNLSMPQGAGPFAQQFITLYQNSLGTWVGALVGFAALATMFSTSLTCLQAQPLALGLACSYLWPQSAYARYFKDAAFYLLLFGTLFLLFFMQNHFTFLIQIATILSFLTTPFFAFCNHYLVFRVLPPDLRPNKALYYWSCGGLVFLLGFSLVYLLSLVA